MTVAAMTMSTIGSSRLVWCLPMTLSKKYLGENGSARPATRLIDINNRPRSMTPLRGRSSAQISGSAFQVSVVLFFGFAAGLSDAIAGAVTATVGCVDIPSRFPGDALVLVRCGYLNFDYTPHVPLCVRRPTAFFTKFVTNGSSRPGQGKLKTFANSCQKARLILAHQPDQCLISSVLEFRGPENHFGQHRSQTQAFRRQRVNQFAAVGWIGSGGDDPVFLQTAKTHGQNVGSDTFIRIEKFFKRTVAEQHHVPDDQQRPPIAQHFHRSIQRTPGPALSGRLLACHAG